MVTVNGRVRIRRVRWHDRQTGSETPMDRVLDESEQRISRGVRELVCRLNQCSSSFVLTAENLYRAAHIQLSKETARQLIEREAKGVLRQTQRGELAPEWEAEDCRSPQGTRRLYIGCDGVKVRVVTDEEKKQRRKKIRQKRRRGGGSVSRWGGPSRGPTSRTRSSGWATFTTSRSNTAM